MRKLIIVALVLVVIGVGVSFLLIPDKKDIAVTQQRDVALVAQGNVDVEAEYNQGRRSFPIISGLADKRVKEGNRPAAITLIEEYVKANPNDVQGHKKLAEQYQLAGRQPDFNAQLEQIAALAPTEENLRVLSDIYNADKNYPKQVEVLKKLITVTNGSNPQVYADLATIQVVVGDKDGALTTLDELKAKHPDFQSYAVTRIRVNILAERGKADEAFTTAKAWVDRPLPPMNNPAQVPPSATPKAVVTTPVITPSSQLAKELADLTNILHYSGHADKAVELVEPHIELLQESTELVVAYVNANITLGRDEHAYTILTQIDQAGKMTPDLYLPYLQLAIKREDTAAAEGIANKLDVATFNEEQALNIIEVARANNAPSVLDILLARFGDPAVEQNKPVLTAVISIMKKEKDQDDKINVALNTQLSSIQRLRLAEACARADKTACFDTIIKQYPPMDQMTTQQIAEYAQLYIIAEKPAAIFDAVNAQAMKPDSHPDVQDAQRKLACAAGRADIMKPWLQANANTAPVIKLQEYFYLANDRKHYDISTDIAERMYARDPSPMSRDLMVAAYMGQENYAKALPYLREQIKQEGANDGQYIAALSKLARKDKDARKELTDYAQASLQSNKGTPKDQLNYAYALLNNGRRDAAMPFVKQYAGERGGEWKKMYAQLTAKPGTGKGGKPARQLTREEMIAMANNPNMSEANRRQMAFNLVNRGYKADATNIFAQLAANKGPDSQEVKDLLYMWGGKLDTDQMAWLQSRAASANGYDRSRWADLINTYADDYSVMQYVSATPDALYNPNLRQKYFRVLAINGGRQNFDTNMRGWVAQTTDVPALVDYAKTADAFGYKDAAHATYQHILEIDPNNEAALNHMASSAFSKGSYSTANQYVDRYISAQSMKPMPETDPAQPHFFKAELLRHQGNTPAANQEYMQVVRMTPVYYNTPSDALSRLYTAEFRLGQHAQAKAGFEQLLSMHPDDKSILADYMSVLIEYKYYEDATRVANQYDKNSPYYGRGASLYGSSAHVAAIQPMSGGREMRIAFNQPIDQQPPIDFAHAQQLAWLEGAKTGYDDVVISAKPGYVIRYTPTAGEQFAVVATPVEEVSPQVATDRAQDLRLQLLYAQIEQQTGQTERARQRLAVLQKYYPNEPQLMVSQAGVESADGNTSRAFDLLQQAQAQLPQNEDLAAQMRALRHTGSQQYVKADMEWRNYGGNYDQIATVSGVARVGDRMEAGVTIANDHYNNQSSNRQQAEIFLAQYLDGGDRLQGSLFLDGNVIESDGYDDESFIGAGLYYAFNNQLGRTELMGEYHKPYWDFPEAIYTYTSRDRVGLKHYTNLSPDLSMGLETSVNNYSLEQGPNPADPVLPGAVDDNIEQTFLLRMSFAYALQQQTESQPYFGIGYGFDGEYVIDTDSALVNQFPEMREVHQFTGIYRDDWTPSTHVLFSAGWMIDRYGETGPVAEGRLTQDITDEIELGLRGRYGLQTSVHNASSNDKDAINLGSYLMYKF